MKIKPMLMLLQIPCLLLTGCKVVSPTENVTVPLYHSFAISKNADVSISDSSVAEYKDGKIYGIGIGKTQVTVDELFSKKTYSISVKTPDITDENTDIDNNFTFDYKRYDKYGTLIASGTVLSYENGMRAEEEGKTTEFYYDFEGESLAKVYQADGQYKAGHVNIGMQIDKEVVYFSVESFRSMFVLKTAFER